MRIHSLPRALVLLPVPPWKRETLPTEAQSGGLQVGRCLCEVSLAATSSLIGKANQVELGQ